MTFRSFAMIGVVLCVAACSSNNSVQNDDEFNPVPNDASTASDSSMSNFCSDYCSAITTKGTGCGTYNQNNRCTTNCAFYYKSVCKPEWQIFATCVSASTGIECIAQDGGFPVLSTLGCVSEGNNFHQCIEEKDAGFCPY